MDEGPVKINLLHNRCLTCQRDGFRIFRVRTEKSYYNEDDKVWLGKTDEYKYYVTCRTDLLPMTNVADLLYVLKYSEEIDQYNKKVRRLGRIEIIFCKMHCKRLSVCFSQKKIMRGIED